MISSMTGYGYAENRFDGITYTVEIRVVNNRYFKSKLNLPEQMAFLEDDIQKLLQKSLFRGMADYTLWLKNASSNLFFDIDEQAIQSYLGRLGKIASSSKVNCQIDIGTLLTVPGILTPVPPETQKAKEIKEIVLNITREAIQHVRQMRLAEGAVLAADLDNNCRAIKESLDRIRPRSQAAIKEYQEKLRKRVDELLADAKLRLDEASLAREVAIFADKSDISEEIARLDSHLQQFARSCQTDGQAGRRLDFISQEMLREANTIASKAADVEIIQRVLEIKCNIERIKEQVQNVE
jgi:uncharacterized protein (TIGR00255 family)